MDDDDGELNDSNRQRCGDWTADLSSEPFGEPIIWPSVDSSGWFGEPSTCPSDFSSEPFGEPFIWPSESLLIFDAPGPSGISRDLDYAAGQISSPFPSQHAHHVESNSRHSMLVNAESLTVTPTQPQYEPNAQPAQTTTNTRHGCPICQKTFIRKQDRDRHVELYLPHSIYCPYNCSWTGRRPYEFTNHCKTMHPDSQGVMKTNQIYDSKKFVKSILDGTPLDEVEQSACSLVQERLNELGMADVEADIWGRKKRV